MAKTYQKFEKHTICKSRIIFAVRLLASIFIMIMSFFGQIFSKVFKKKHQFSPIFENFAYFWQRLRPQLSCNVYVMGTFLIN